jgi:hypothetical protein
MARQEAIDARDQLEQALVQRWGQLKDAEVRSALVKDAASDILRSSSIGRGIHELLNGRFSGPLISTLGLAYASTRGGLGKRMLFSGISLALGKVVEQQENGGPGMLTKIAEGIGSIVRGIRERNAQRQAVDQDTRVYEDEPMAP